MLTIAEEKFIAMVDTGSTISLLNSKKVLDKVYEKMIGEKVHISTIEGQVRKDTEYVKTKCPVEFRQPNNARMRWGKIDLDKPYDFLIGMDWIENNVKVIDMNNKEIVLKNEEKLPFLSKKIEEVNMLEESDLGNIKINHLNEEEKRLFLIYYKNIKDCYIKMGIN